MEKHLYYMGRNKHVIKLRKYQNFIVKYKNFDKKFIMSWKKKYIINLFKDNKISIKELKDLLNYYNII